MKINWNYIKAVFLLGLVVFLYSFSKSRNTVRKIESTSVVFTNGENLYITETAVDKLLIQKKEGVKNLTKDTLNLSMLEKELSQNEMIADADVYLTVNGVLGATITQRKPIARVFSENPFYVDSEGKSMPLSSFYSARVPILVGIGEKQMKVVFPLLKVIESDPFLQRHVVGIKRLPQKGYALQIRTMDFSVFFGEIKNIERKIKNFKAFYKKAMNEGKLKTFKKVSLQFENQVVCTKK